MDIDVEDPQAAAVALESFGKDMANEVPTRSLAALLAVSSEKLAVIDEMETFLNQASEYADDCLLINRKTEIHLLAVSAVPSSFPRFNSLPLELRHLVYKLANPSRDFRAGWNMFNYRSGQNTIPPPPVLLWVCRESRRFSVGLGGYFGFARAPARQGHDENVYWCDTTAIDTIYLPRYVDREDRPEKWVTHFPGQARCVATDAIFMARQLVQAALRRESYVKQPTFFRMIGDRCVEWPGLEVALVLTTVVCSEPASLFDATNTRVVPLDDPGLPEMLLPSFREARWRYGKHSMLHQGTHAFVKHLQRQWTMFALPLIKEDWLRSHANGRHKFKKKYADDPKTLYTTFYYGTKHPWRSFDTNHRWCKAMLEKMPKARPAIVFEKEDPEETRRNPQRTRQCTGHALHMLHRRLAISTEHIDDPSVEECNCARVVSARRGIEPL